MFHWNVSATFYTHDTQAFFHNWDVRILNTSFNLKSFSNGPPKESSGMHQHKKLTKYLARILHTKINSEKKKPHSSTIGNCDRLNTKNKIPWYGLVAAKILSLSRA